VVHWYRRRDLLGKRGDIVSLNYDLTRVDQEWWKDGTYGEPNPEWFMTERIILLTMSVGMGEITEKNAGEFYARVHVVEGFYPPGDFDHHTKALDIARRVGLATNVTTLTRSQWQSGWVKRNMDELAKNFVTYADAQAKAKTEQDA
jgi:hypothetical protein